MSQLAFNAWPDVSGALTGQVVLYAIKTTTSLYRTTSVFATQECMKMVVNVNYAVQWQGA